MKLAGKHPEDIEADMRRHTDGLPDVVCHWCDTVTRFRQSRVFTHSWKSWLLKDLLRHPLLTAHGYFPRTIYICDHCHETKFMTAWRHGLERSGFHLRAEERMAELALFAPDPEDREQALEILERTINRPRPDTE
jgi:hypothetical protein